MNAFKQGQTVWKQTVQMAHSQTHEAIHVADPFKLLASEAGFLKNTEKKPFLFLFLILTQD